MTAPKPHPALRQHALRSLAGVLDLQWVEGHRHGVVVPEAPQPLVHYTAQDNGYDLAREVLCDGTAQWVRFGTQALQPSPYPTSITALKRELLCRHLDALAKANPQQARPILAMLVCTNPGRLARLLAAHTSHPIPVPTNPHALIWDTLHLHSPQP